MMILRVQRLFACSLVVCTALVGQDAAFIENVGQCREGVSHLAATGNVACGVTDDGFTLVRIERDSGHAVHFSIEGADAARCEAWGPEEPVPRVYFVHGEARRARASDGVILSGIRPGADLAVRLRRDRPVFEYDLHVESSAVLDNLIIRTEGVERWVTREDGSLVAQTPIGELVQENPRAFVTRNGEELELTARFEVIDEDALRLVVDGSRADEPIFVDPTLVWGTYLGGLLWEVPLDVRVAADGTVVTGGTTTSFDFPVTPGPFEAKVWSDNDVFVSRFSGDGSTLLASTVLVTNEPGDDGLSHDIPDGLVLTPTGEAIVTGYTEAADFPTTPGAYEESYVGKNDAFLFQLNVAGDALVFSTYLGGPGSDFGRAVARSGDGSIVVVGRVNQAAPFPTTPDAYQTTPAGFADTFVSRFSPDGSQLLASTLLGGVLNEFVSSVGVLSGGDIVVGGRTDSQDFPLTPGVLQGTFSSLPGFLSRFTSDLSSLVASTYSPVIPAVLQCLDSGNLVVGGAVNDPTVFTPSPDAYKTDGPGSGLAIVDPFLTEFLRATYSVFPVVTSTLEADQWGIVIGDAGGTADLVTTPDAVSPTKPTGSTCNGFVVRYDLELKALLYSTYYGGPGGAYCGGLDGVAVAANGDAIVVGNNYEVPTTPGSYDPTYSGGIEGFVARIRTVAPFDTIGPGLAGTTEPLLIGYGAPIRDEVIGVGILNGPPSGFASLVIGAAALSAPFKGGVFVPTPDIFVPSLPLDAGGDLDLASTWPPGIPAGVSTFFQAWFADEGAPSGFSSTNGLTTVSQ